MGRGGESRRPGYSVQQRGEGAGGYEVEVVHLGDQPQRIAEAEAAGVRSVPALVVEGQVLHLNFGASIDDLK